MDVEVARRVLTEIAEAELAFVWPEAEARASDFPWRSEPHRVDPHLLRAARLEMLLDGTLVRTTETTRGGRDIPVLMPAGLDRRQRAAADAAGRKRLLYARYLTWAQGTDPETPGGIVGPAAERVLHHSLRAASPTIGYQLENPSNGETATVLDVKIDSGPLDNVAHVFLGNPPVRHTLAFEAKSWREYFYADDPDDVFQVLAKAAFLTSALPQTRVVPVLFCRRAHITAFRMFHDLGGYIIEARQQWVPERTRVTPEVVGEVRAGLGFSDFVLEPSDLVHGPTLRHLALHLPKVLERQAERWRTFGSQFGDQYNRLWSGGNRHDLAVLRSQARETEWATEGW